MSENTLRPVWTPEDYEQTRRDAAKHRAIPAIADPDDTQPDLLVEHQDADLAGWHPLGYVTDEPVRGRHRAATVAGMRPRRAARLAKTAIAVGTLVLVLALGALWASSQAKALPAGCQSQPWLYGGLFGRMTTRTICDGPIRGDGSWIRHRNFYAPSYYKPTSCSFGRYSGSCTGGYRVAEFDSGVEEYVVTADTVLADEPGWIA